MDPFQEFSRKRTEFERAKGEILIGLFGSFKRDEIRQLRQALLDDNYHVKISLDLESELPKKPGISDDEYNYELSVALVHQCDIHIFLFHRERRGEHSVNQSASMELQYFATRKQSKSALILLEHGYVAQSGGVFKGLKAKTHGTWRWETYRNFQALQDTAKKFIFNRILAFVHS